MDYYDYNINKAHTILDKRRFLAVMHSSMFGEKQPQYFSTNSLYQVLRTVVKG